jgi:hypothetical protein
MDKKEKWRGFLSKSFRRRTFSFGIGKKFAKEKKDGDNIKCEDILVMDQKLLDQKI